MSTRWYPLYQRGNPQLRVFLPNFWMKIIKPTHRLAPNVVQFACSMQMTKHDVRQYLEKIYNIPVMQVRTRIALGTFKRNVGGAYIIKEDDTKIAYITLPRGETFEFPDIFPDEKNSLENEEKALDDNKKVYKEYVERNSERPGVPGWFAF